MASRNQDRLLVDKPGFVSDQDCQLCCGAHRYHMVRHSFIDNALYVQISMQFRWGQPVVLALITVCCWDMS
eukprot:scaffold19412_cov54-Cylindrotheca_fusiformis.AAC.1